MESHSEMATFKPKIVMRNPADLRPHPKNARTHSRKQIGQLAQSLEEFGFTNPLLVSDSGEVIAGHGRLAAALHVGLTEVPTIRLSHLSEVQRRAYMLADNQLALNAGWDQDLLAAELVELGDLDFDLPVLGFEADMVDTLIARTDDASAEAVDRAEDEIPISPEIAVTRPGDLWQLGRHRLICGDARNPQVYQDLLQGEKVDLLCTDPPYNVPIDGHVCGSGRIRHREFAMGVGEMSRDEFTRFLVDSLRPAAASCVDGAIAYVCMDWRHLEELSIAGREVFSELKNVCVWNKKNAGMGTFYRSKHEMIFVFKVGKAEHINNFGLGDKGRYRTNVWDYAGITSPGKARLTDLAMHPTVKPVAMIVDAMRDCSRRGSVVLDMFGGSGSTLIAAQNCGRKARLVEFDPHYCDVIVRRFEAVTGQEGRLVNRKRSAT